MDYINQIETTNNNIARIYGAQLSDKEFSRLSQFIIKETGIKIHQGKRIMLQSRLYKRLKSLNIYSFGEYCDYVFSKMGYLEIDNMIDVVCTNKTSFFRESHHFEFLTEFILPKLLNQNNRYIKIWSAGCSSGEEPYTIAMVIQFFIESIRKPLDFQILGTDISTIMLNTAVNAVYDVNRMNEIPQLIKNKYLLKSKSADKQTVRINREIRNKIMFRRLNLMDNSYDVQDKFDVIFCRNVLIYFERELQEKVIYRLCKHLKPGGYFLIGHSESLFSMDLPLTQLKPTIFQKLYS